MLPIVVTCLLVEDWVVFLQVFICTKALVVAMSVVVALLGTCHNIDVVNTKLMSILCIGITNHIVFPIVSHTSPTEIVVRI